MADLGAPVLVDARLVPAILLLQQYVDEERWGSVTVQFRKGTPDEHIALGQTVRTPVGKVASGAQVAILFALPDQS